jgi:hypothetical protein
MVALLCWAAAQSPERCAEFLLSRQRDDGSFDTRDAAEEHASGYNALIGLALLSQTGWSPALEKLLGFILKNQQPNKTWVPTRRGSKFLFSNGWIATFLLEVWTQRRDGRTALSAELKERLGAALERGVEGIVETQLEEGGWPYEYGARRGHGAYRETATSVGNLHALAMARAAGFKVPEESIRRAVDYLRANFKDGGFINGAMESEPSIHLTPALLCALLWLPELGVEDLIRGATRFLDDRAESAYWVEWKFDEWDSIPRNLRGQARFVVERRQIFGLFFSCLARRRAGEARRFEELHTKAAALLRKHAATEASWRSTIGEAPTTALALLTLNLSRPDALVFFSRRPGRE